MPKVEVCLTPVLIDYFDLNNKTVVVVDIFRATSCMVTALASGIDHIYPVAEVEACKSLMQQGYMGAAERKGLPVDGIPLGNSPLQYLNDHIKGEKLAMTTTNGTLALSKSVNASKVLIGAFLNLSALCKKLIDYQNDVIIHCSGWRGHFNLEDTVMAGAIINETGFVADGDSAHMVKTLYKNAENNMDAFLKNGSHYQRLVHNGNKEDIPFCLSKNKFNVVPYLKDEKLYI